MSEKKPPSPKAGWQFHIYLLSSSMNNTSPPINNSTPKIVCVDTVGNNWNGATNSAQIASAFRKFFMVHPPKE